MAMKVIPGIALAAAVGIGCWIGFTPEANAELPDVLIVVIDDMESGEPEYILPTIANPYRDLTNLKALAADGLRLTRFYGQTWCAPMRDSLMLAKVAGLPRGRWDCTATPTPTSVDFGATFTLARMFKEHGYSTAFFGKWHEGVDATTADWRDAPSRSGFDTVRVAFTLGSVCSQGKSEVLTDGVLNVVPGDMDARLRDAAAAWWTTTEGPKFAYVALQGAHQPFAIPTEILPTDYPFLPNTKRAKYEAELIGCDRVVGSLRALTDSDDYFAAMSDNGTPPDATRIGQDPAKVKQSAFEGGVHCFFAMTGPGIAPGSLGASLACAADVLPTFAEVLGFAIPPVEGISLVSVQRQTVFAHGPLGDVPESQLDTMVRGERWKLLQAADGAEHLYDLALDPLELAPLPPNGPVASVLRAERVSILGR